MKIYVKLSGSARGYNFDGQLYQAGKVYSVPEARAKILLQKKDHEYRPYFSMLTPWEVEKLTGEKVQAAPKPEPAPAPKAEIVESEETEAEAQAQADALKQAEEDAALDAEPAITDPDVEEVGAPPKPQMELAGEGEEFTDI